MYHKINFKNLKIFSSRFLSIILSTGMCAYNANAMLKISPTIPNASATASTPILYKTIAITDPFIVELISKAINTLTHFNHEKINCFIPDMSNHLESIKTKQKELAKLKLDYREKQKSEQLYILFRDHFPIIDKLYEFNQNAEKINQLYNLEHIKNNQQFIEQLMSDRRTSLNPDIIKRNLDTLLRKSTTNLPNLTLPDERTIAMLQDPNSFYNQGIDNLISFYESHLNDFTSLSPVKKFDSQPQSRVLPLKIISTTLKGEEKSSSRDLMETLAALEQADSDAARTPLMFQIQLHTNLCISETETELDKNILQFKELIPTLTSQKHTVPEDFPLKLNAVCATITQTNETKAKILNTYTKIYDIIESFKNTKDFFRTQSTYETLAVLSTTTFTDLFRNGGVSTKSPTSST